jgi:hypothetical protein
MRALREDVENQLAAIDHSNLEFILKVTSLRGTERVVENRQRCALRLRQLAHLAGLTFSNKSARIRRFQPLPNNPGDLRTRTLGQCFKFVERFVAANPRLGTKFDSNQDSALVMLMGNVVGLSQMITSIAENLTIKPIRYQQSSVRHTLLILGAGVTPAQGSTKPTAGFVTIKSS